MKIFAIIYLTIGFLISIISFSTLKNNLDPELYEEYVKTPASFKIVCFTVALFVWFPVIVWNAIKGV